MTKKKDFALTLIEVDHSIEKIMSKKDWGDKYPRCWIRIAVYRPDLKYNQHFTTRHMEYYMTGLIKGLETAQPGKEFCYADFDLVKDKDLPVYEL